SAIVGYTLHVDETRLCGMHDAFRHGARPSGGLAPRLDRIAMLLAGPPNMRDLITSPQQQLRRRLLLRVHAPVPPQRRNLDHTARSAGNATAPTPLPSTGSPWAKAGIGARYAARNSPAASAAS